eukprot:1710424-Lingulodinium_polyedra.AAC.1
MAGPPKRALSWATILKSTAAPRPRRGTVETMSPGLWPSTLEPPPLDVAGSTVLTKRSTRINVMPMRKCNDVATTGASHLHAKCQPASSTTP